MSEYRDWLHVNLIGVDLKRLDAAVDSRSEVTPSITTGRRLSQWSTITASA